MKYRVMGRTGLSVSEICLGTMTFGDQVDATEAKKIVEYALNAGVNFIDTADVYSYGAAEEIVGKTLMRNRASVILATKVGFKTGDGPNQSGLSRKRIIEQVDGSLKRLRTDYIDVYYAHLPDDNIPIEESLRAFDALISQGKVRYIGCSNFSAWQLCKALWVSDLHDLTRFECIQPPYNLLTRDIEYELFPLCKNEGIGVCVYNPLAGGLLSGKYDIRKRPAKGSRFSTKSMGKLYNDRYWSKSNFRAISRLKSIAEKGGRTIAQFSIAWILSNPLITSVICGVSSAKQLEHNLSAAELRLADYDLIASNEVWRQISPPRFLYGR